MRAFPGAGKDEAEAKARQLRARNRHVAVLMIISVLALGAAIGPTAHVSAAPCPNEVLRSENRSLGLPDCRAYERATPAVKNGGEFWSQQLNFVGDGPRLAFESFATFGGSEFASTLGTAFELGRSSTGWVTHPLGGPASQFEGTNEATPLYALGSENQTLLGLRERNQPVDAESFYLRQGSSIIPIGPEAPPSKWFGNTGQENVSTNRNQSYFNFQTATPNLSHILFELHTPEAGGHDYLWPFDATAGEFKRSAYEYAGTGNSQPFLVGVTGGRESNALISGCGTSIGSFENGDTYNAISTDGSIVYFTPWGEDVAGSCSSSIPAPEHTEVYARVDGEQNTAHTVAISEPSTSDCSACQTTARQEATFQGASANGRKVFFLTEQELLPGNPGKALYEFDFDGPPGEKVTAVSHIAGGASAGVLGVARVSQDGSHVYFVATAELTTDANSVGNAAIAGEPNLYAYDTTTSETKFVATLAPGDAEKWSTFDINRQAEATPNGRFLLFASVGDLTPDDTSTVSQLFRYDFTTGELIRISIGQGGFNNNGNTDADPVTMSLQVDKYAFSQNSPPQKMMSDDGSYIYFESTKGLTPNALDHIELPNHVGFLAENVYEWNNGELSLLTDGQDRTYIGFQLKFEQRSSVRLLGTDSSGENVFFTTASPLIPTDTDEAQDIYAARIGGGFPVPSQGLCSDEGCQGRQTVAPETISAGSSQFVGPGNTKPAHKKKKHRKRHKHKTVKQRHGQSKNSSGGSK